MSVVEVLIADGVEVQPQTSRFEAGDTVLATESRVGVSPRLPVDTACAHTTASEFFALRYLNLSRWGNRSRWPGMS